METAKAKARLEKALNPDYWESLVPLASVCRPTGGEILSPTGYEADNRSALDGMKEEGWFRLEGFFPEQRVRKMAECVLELDRAGWLPTYCFVFDEFWDLIRGAAFHQLLEEMIGPGYLQKVAAWIHLIKPAGTAHGWPPHVDASSAEGPTLHSDGSLRLLSVWIALSDATVDNGCMYLLPIDRIPPGEYTTRGSSQLLQSAQSIPLNAGAIAGWRQDLLHWGSFSSRRALGPRISIAVEFQSATENGNPKYPLIDERHIPNTLEERLYFISQQVLSYLYRFDPEQATEGHLAVAETLGVSLEEYGRDWIRTQPASLSIG